ncbi:MAG: polysaccharide pyruvyl transferase family protein [Candidatus Aenigmatarchaeota archaeon]
MKYGVVYAKSDNIGDDIQTVAVLQFLPRADFWIDRENLHKVESDDVVKVILNGWYTGNPWSWPPSEAIQPLIISIHISPHVSMYFLRNKVVRYLKRWEPIGARDLWTLKLLKYGGVNAYFSGCLTLTLDKTYKTHKRSDHVLVVDVPPLVERVILKRFGDRIVKWSNALVISKPQPMTLHVRRVFKLLLPLQLRYHLGVLSSHFDYLISRIKIKGLTLERRLKIASAVIKLVASAQAVVTSRLHIALPALALETPLVFIPRDPNDMRFSGYRQFMAYFCPVEKAAKCIREFKPEDYTIPNRRLLEDLKEDMQKRVYSFLET